MGRTWGRLLSVELLRVCAMLGIVTFHTFQPWFESVVSGSDFLTPAEHALLSRPVTLAVLGSIDQLGAWGNHVFIMISGCFLLPRAQSDLDAGQPMGSVMRQSLRRAEGVLFTIALYAMAAIALSVWLPDATSVGMDNLGWFAQGLQFVWIYLLLVVLCPVIAQVSRRIGHRNAVLAALVLAVYGVNARIAFVSPGGQVRGIFEWRKLMSGVTYGLSFLVGGWLSHHVPRESRRHGAALSLVASVGLTLFAEAWAAGRGDLALLDALSFKSTSFPAFAMAACALSYALGADPNLGGRKPSLSRAVAFATSGMLGFYVLQALLSRGWHHLSNRMLTQVLAVGFPSFLLAGMAFGVLLFVLLVALDAVTRQPLARLLLPKG